MACSAQLRWYDMVPVFSWVLLRGRCRSCRAWISFQYPLVEVSTAILFAIIGFAPLHIVFKLFSLAIVSLLVMITVYDMRHTIIPDEWAYSFAVLALALSFAGLPPGTDTVQIILTLCAGPITALPLFALWAMSGGRWMGLGDPKLALGIGWLLDVPLGLYAVFLAFVIGALVSIFVLLPLGYLRSGRGITHLGGSGRRFTMESEVPFGPFLVASCVLVWYANMYGLSLLFF